MIRFERAITVEGVPYQAGDVVDEATIPAGSMQSLRMGYIVDVPAEPVSADAADSTDKPTSKKGK